MRSLSLQRCNPERLLTSESKLPVGKHLVLVDFNPGLHHLQLLGRNASRQHAAPNAAQQ